MEQKNTARLILEVDNRILMLERRLGDGGFTLVGGNIEKGETPKQALIRECFEEVGIRLKVEDLELLHLLHYQNTAVSNMILFFRAQKWKGDIVNKEPHKFKAIKWFPIKKLPSTSRPIVLKALQCWLKGLTYSEWTSRTIKKT